MRYSFFMLAPLAAIAACAAFGAEDPVAGDDDERDGGGADGGGADGTLAKPAGDASAPEILADGIEGVYYLAVDEEAVYAGTEADIIVKVPLAAVVTTTLARGLAKPRSVVLHDGYVYYAAQDGDAGEVGRVPKDGGGIEHFTSADIGPTWAIAIGGDRIYGCENAPGGKHLHRITLDGFYEDQSNDVVFDCRSIVTTSKVGFVGGDDIRRFNFDKSNEIVLSSSTAPTMASRLAADEESLFWIAETNVMRASIPGLAARKVVATIDVPPSWRGDITLDGDYVYWTTGTEGGSVQRAKKDGTGTVDTLASGLAIPIGIAVDEGHVYWAENGAGKIMRVAKP